MIDLDTAAEAADALGARDLAADAEDMAAAFEAAGTRIAASLEKAAQSGKLSFEGMVDAVLKDLARIAAQELIEAPLTALFDGFIGKAGGASASGPSAPTINVNVAPGTDASSFRRSEGQIAASLARAVSVGRGRI